MGRSTGHLGGGPGNSVKGWRTDVEYSGHCHWWPLREVLGEGTQAVW